MSDCDQVGIGRGGLPVRVGDVVSHAGMGASGYGIVRKVQPGGGGSGYGGRCDALVDYGSSEVWLPAERLTVAVGLPACRFEDALDETKVRHEQSVCRGDPASVLKGAVVDFMSPEAVAVVVAAIRGVGVLGLAQRGGVAGAAAAGEALRFAAVLEATVGNDDAWCRLLRDAGWWGVEGYQPR